MPVKKPKAPSTTGRDEYIISKALAYAISTIESLPEIRQEANDCRDMRALLEARLPSAQHRDRMMQGAQAHTGIGEQPFFLGRRVGHLTVVE